MSSTPTVVITGSTFTGNSAVGGNGGSFNNGAGSNALGGSIYVEGGTLNIDGSRIENSAATGGQGGSVSQNGQENGGFGGLAQGGGDTQNPSITAPPDAAYQCASEVPAANPNQATASDNCGAPAVTVSETTNVGAGSPASPLIITRKFKATDASTNSASATQIITVIDDTPPAISCPGDITVNAVAGTCAANVSFSVGATDNCSSATVGTDHLSGSSFPAGTTTVHATAMDAAGNTSTCSFTVTVKDITPPVINLSGNVITLWPPNHMYATVNVTDLVASASDLCDPTVSIDSVVIASVSSDEPNNSDGDGNTTNDIVIAPGCKSVQLVAERMGGGNGRVYTITFKVTDGSGNSTTVTANVTVPKSQNGTTAVDDGPNYTVNGCP